MAINKKKKLSEDDSVARHESERTERIPSPESRAKVMSNLHGVLSIVRVFIVAFRSAKAERFESFCGEKGDTYFLHDAKQDGDNSLFYLNLYLNFETP